MNSEQLRLHLALAGWVAFTDPNGFNLTHPEYGTVWSRGSGMVHESRVYMYGLFDGVCWEANLTNAPDNVVEAVLRRMEAYHD